MKPETRFRTNQVRPFLKRLKNTFFIAIQQVAIIGDPDYILCINGIFVALELKRRGEKPSPLQEHKLNKVEKAGGVRIVADPDNWETVKKQLLEMSERKFEWKSLNKAQ